MPLFGLPGLPGLPDGTRVHHSLHEQIHDGVELDVGGDLPGMAPGSSKIGVASAGRPVNNNTIAFTTTSMWGRARLGAQASSEAARRRSGAPKDDPLVTNTGLPAVLRDDRAKCGTPCNTRGKNRASVIGGS